MLIPEFKTFSLESVGIKVSICLTVLLSKARFP